MKRTGRRWKRPEDALGDMRGGLVVMIEDMRVCAFADNRIGKQVPPRLRESIRETMRDMDSLEQTLAAWLIHKGEAIQ